MMAEKITLNDCVEIQKAYKRLGKDIPFTKKNMCDILAPFRERFGLTDREILAVARNELSLQQINDLIERK